MLMMVLMASHQPSLGLQLTAQENLIHITGSPAIYFGGNHYAGIWYPVGHKTSFKESADLPRFVVPSQIIRP